MSAERRYAQLKVVIGADHAGYSLKEELKEVLRQEGIEFLDIGTMNGEESVDYPDFAEQVARKVATGEFDRGVVICGTGIGVAIAANKVKGIRAANCSDPVSARFSREHNDANVLAVGERIIGPAIAREILKVWLNTDFEGGRHARRVNKIGDIEERSGVSE
ncbi:MAG TPA: ribose 5-phosphate isomerase B [Anaerolineae bacterium]|nr:ribose 5-phosphate isomerase B [Anaerolineae bacterium]